MYSAHRRKKAAYLFLLKKEDVKQWIETSLNQKMEIESKKHDDFAKWLQNGSILAKLWNNIYDNSIPQQLKSISKPIAEVNSKLAYKNIENIIQFLDQCKAIGFKDYQLFEPIDCYERKNVVRVVYCVHFLMQTVDKKFLRQHLKFGNTPNEKSELPFQVISEEEITQTAQELCFQLDNMMQNSSTNKPISPSKKADFKDNFTFDPKERFEITNNDFDDQNFEPVNFSIDEIELTQKLNSFDTSGNILFEDLKPVVKFPKLLTLFWITFFFFWSYLFNSQNKKLELFYL